MQHAIHGSKDNQVKFQMQQTAHFLDFLNKELWP